MSTTYYIDNSLGNDANAGTSAGSGNAFKTIGKFSSVAVAGDVGNAINTSDYAITAEIAFATAGSLAAGPITLRGYATTPGDGGRIRITTATNSIKMLNLNADFLELQDFELINTAGTPGIGIYSSAATRNNIRLANFRIDGCVKGIDNEFTTFWSFTRMIVNNAEIANCATYGASLYQATLTDVLIRGCGEGLRNSSQTNNQLKLVRCRIYNSTNYAINWATDNTSELVIFDSVLRLSGSDLIRLNFTTSAISLQVENSILYGAGGYGIHSVNSKYLTHQLRNVAFRSNTSGNYDSFITNSLGEITLTGDPHTNAAAYDFSLNNTAGAGAACRAAGFSGSWGGTGYQDVGGLQHQDAGGSSGGGPLTGNGSLVAC